MYQPNPVLEAINGFKRQLVAPVTQLVAATYLDDRLQKKISRLKKERPHLKIGETHCHTKFSDGHATNHQILHRAAQIGLDYVIITDHLLPGRYALKSSIASIQQSWKCIDEWNHRDQEPVQVYPAIEVSTLEGHLILVFNADYLQPAKSEDIARLFEPLDRKMISMEETAKMAAPFGGVSIIPHPNLQRAYPFGVSTEFTRKYLTGLVDGIEDISTGHGLNQRHSDSLGMAYIGSSDDHFNILIGTAVTAYDATRYRDPIQAIKNQATEAIKIDCFMDHPLQVARVLL